MKIYTKTGDQGKTSLYNGKRLLKDDIKIEAYGTVDELNSNIGLLHYKLKSLIDVSILDRVQNQLFVIGSHLATPVDSDLKLPEIKTELIEEMEQSIDAMESELEPLKNFVLPGGSEKISICHICRTICRRAERRCVTLAQEEEMNPLIIQVLNRLSDYLFVLSRYTAFKEGVKEIPWIP